MDLNQPLQIDLSKNCKRNSFFRVTVFIFLFAMFFTIGLFLGSRWSIQQSLLNKSGTVEISKIINLYSRTRSSEVDFNQFWEVWDAVKEKYVGQPVSDVDLFYGAIGGIVSGLDDPYSVYFPPVEAEEFSKDLAGEFEGIGAEIGIRDNQLTIIAPLPESPAEKAGLEPGDKILAIDSEDTSGIKLDVAVGKIRGPKGTEVVLTVTHNGFETVEDIKVIRDTINVPTIDWEMVKDTKIAYLRITYFNQDTWLSFDKAVREILRENPDGLVLDLRSNPGGFLESAIDIASEWIKQGVVVRERSGDGYEQEHKSRGAHRLAGLKTVVLVDEGTASGSEIVAGALQDHNMATVVGMKTFGKGSVQDFEVLSDGSALKLTIAKWFTPDDRVIDGEGVKPDIVLEKMFVPVEEENEDGKIMIVDVEDKGVEKALEILNN